MWVAYREVLRTRDARALIAAGAVSQLGDWLYNAALLGYVYSVTRSAGAVGAATIVRLIPYVLLGPLGGTLADRHSRRTVLLVSDAARALLMAALAGLVAAHAPVITILALTALASAAGSADRPAAMALLPRLVGESRLGAANALLHTAQDVGIIVGPALGAVLFAVATSWAAFAVNAATFIASALLNASIARDRPPVAAAASVPAQLRRGLRTVKTTRFVPALFCVVAMVELIYGAQTVQLVIYAQHTLGLGPGGYGRLLAGTGVGGVLSAAVTGRLATHRHASLVVIAASGLMCATQFAYAGTSVAAYALVAAAVGGAGIVSCEVVAETLLARIVPDDALGRIMGIFAAMSVAAMVVGALIAPVLVAGTSLPTSLIILGAGTSVVTVGAGWGMRGLDAVSARRARELAARVDALAALPVTVGVQRPVLERLAAASRFCGLPAGVDVVAQGAPAHAFYAINDGRVAVHRDGRAVVHLGPGDSFGERGLLDGAPRNATATTEAESVLLRVEGAALLDALEAASSLRPALERSSTAPGIRFPAGESELIDDPRWVHA